jgi:leucyl/phenylalanyl-tRNA--protein transferase
MFSRTSDASKVALVHLSERLAAWGFVAIDCQVLSNHLVTLGAREVPREVFTALLQRFCPEPGREGNWDDGDIAFPAQPAPAGAAAFT